MKHLSTASKTVQIASSLPWDFPNAIENLLNTMDACLNNIAEISKDFTKINRTIFPNFSKASDIITTRVYKNTPLLDEPLCTPSLRSRAIIIDDSFPSAISSKYSVYLNALISNLKKRFLSQNSTYQTCQSLGDLFDFTWLLNPTITTCTSIVDIDNISYDDFLNLLKDIHFAPCDENDLKQLFFEYKVLWKFAVATATEFRKSIITSKEFTIHYLKQFVFKHHETCPVIFKFLSFTVCLPISEAIVESWGSTIDFLNKTKRHALETLSTAETGTVDKLAFIKLNGPPPGLKSNKTMLTAALTLMFNGPYSSHFIHSGQRVGCTSKVISRIIDGDASYVLPCFF